MAGCGLGADLAESNQDYFMYIQYQAKFAEYIAYPLLPGWQAKLAALSSLALVRPRAALTPLSGHASASSNWFSETVS